MQIMITKINQKLQVEDKLVEKENLKTLGLCLFCILNVVNERLCEL